MLQILQETRLSLTELAKQQDVAVSTVWRWATRGVKGVRLESYSRAGSRCTSTEAFARFVEATTLATDNYKHSTFTSRHAERNIDASVKYLESENC